MSRGMGPEVESGSTKGDPGSYTARLCCQQAPGTTARHRRPSGPKLVIKTLFGTPFDPFQQPRTPGGHGGGLGRSGELLVNMRPMGGNSYSANYLKPTKIKARNNMRPLSKQYSPQTSADRAR